MLTPDLETRIAILRQKGLDNTLTEEDMREVVLLLREGRRGASIASGKAAAKRTKTAAPKATPNADDMANELGDL